jgi:L-iditol 2-dehydrogenase
MKSIALVDIKKLRLIEVADPVLKGKSDVLLRVKAVGICGSDMHYYNHGKIGDQVVEYPFTIGHEFVAEVIEIGKQVSTLKTGDQVVVDPAISCGTCRQCKEGRPHTCLNLKFLGCPGELPGCMCQYIIMPEKNCYRINRKIAPEKCVVIEPLSIAVYAVSFIKDARIKNIGVLGCGPIGLSVVLAAQVENITSIYVTDLIDKRLEIAKSAGAKWIGNPNKMKISQELFNVEPGRLDAVFECCGDQDALDQAIDLLKPGGRLLIIGIPDISRVSFDISKIRRKEITIYNIRRQNDKIREAIDLLEHKKVNSDCMVTHIFDMKQAKQAFNLVSGYKDGVMKAVIKFS